MTDRQNTTACDYAALAGRIRQWGEALGFQQLGFSNTELGGAEQRLHHWLAAGMHGEMEYMARHGSKRSRPQELVAGTLSVISARMDYLPDAAEPWRVIDDPQQGYISRYALGRDYHKVLRGRLQKLADRIATAIGPFGHRVFVAIPPVLEKPLAPAA